MTEVNARRIGDGKRTGNTCPADAGRMGKWKMSNACAGCRPALHYAGSKRPVAVLVLQDGATRAYEACGLKIDTAEFDRRYPGLRIAFERRLVGL